MGEPAEELLEIADALTRYSERLEDPSIKTPLDKLDAAASLVGKAWSNSWLGHHACVYYADLNSPPPGAHFSQEWGLRHLSFGGGTSGDWREFNFDEVRAFIFKKAKNPNLDQVKDLSKKARREFHEKRSEILSLLTVAGTQFGDGFLEELSENVKKLEVVTASDYVQVLRPHGQIMTRDTLALSQGFRTPPHIAVLSEVYGLRSPLAHCSALADAARRAGSHLARSCRIKRRLELVGTNVFIGHGRSSVWRELKDFLESRVKQPVDEFNRVPIAGITNIARLSEMLDSAAIAFLVMTAEDEQQDGSMNARLNVVHEAGLFQGRLGFTRAIILLEEGCAEFSNIQGLGQVRFPAGNIGATFEKVRQILEREGIIQPV